LAITENVKKLAAAFNLIMKLFLAAAFVAVCCALSNAQNFNHYKTLLPQGLVPKNFTELSANKFATEVTSVTAAENKRDRRNKKKFYLENTFTLDEFLPEAMYRSTII
jgi:hypothetical protein